MNKLINTLRKDNILLWSFSLSILFVLLNCIFILIAFKHLPPFLPLYNKLPWGYARLGTKIELFFPSIIVFIFTIINIYITYLVDTKIVLLARILATITIALSFLTTIYTIQTIRLII